MVALDTIDDVPTGEITSTLRELEELKPLRRIDMADIDKKASLPPGFEQRLLALMNEAEQVAGHAFSVTISEVGVNHDRTLKSLFGRSGYRISRMRAGYTQLNGTYPSLKAVREKILQVKYGDMLCSDDDNRDVTAHASMMKSKGYHLWRCAKCNRVSDDKVMADGSTLVCANIAGGGWSSCSICDHHYPDFGKWEGIGFNPRLGHVDIGSDGHIRISHSIGCLEIVDLNDATDVDDMW